MTLVEWLEKRKELTSRLLYRLSILGNYSDFEIGVLFHLSMTQVQSLRRKYGILIFPLSLLQKKEEIRKQVKEQNPTICDEDFDQAYLPTFEIFCNHRNYNLDKIKKYIIDEKHTQVEKEKRKIRLLSLEQIQEKLRVIDPFSIKKSITILM